MQLGERRVFSATTTPVSVALTQPGAAAWKWPQTTLCELAWPEPLKICFWTLTFKFHTWNFQVSRNSVCFFFLNYLMEKQQQQTALGPIKPGSLFEFGLWFGDLVGGVGVGAFERPRDCWVFRVSSAPPPFLERATCPPFRR